MALVADIARKPPHLLKTQFKLRKNKTRIMRGPLSQAKARACNKYPICIPKEIKVSLTTYKRV